MNCKRPFLAALIAMTFANVTRADDWPNFRGPTHDGISRETGFKTNWQGKPKVLWERDIGAAYSSFACLGDRVYTCGSAEGQQVLFCLEAESGKVEWSRPFEDEYRDQMGNGTRATPTVEDGRVYIVGGHGKVLCCDAKTGSEIWSEQFKHTPQWGYSGSVLIQGNLAIFPAGGSDGATRAVDKTTGKKVWQCDDDEPGYATPLPFEFGGRKFICAFTANRATIIDLDAGKQVGKISWTTDWKVNAAAPIYHDGDLFLNSGYHTGCGLFKLTAKNGKITAKEVWKSKVLMNKFQSAILTGGNLYASDEKAFKCVDFLTGKEKWKEARTANGTLVLADGRLFLLTEKGELRVGKPDPTGFKPTAEAKILDGKCWTAPVLANGRLYARNMDKVVCIDLR
jgi:outer membrane protein assembly factor BamB